MVFGLEAVLEVLKRVAEIDLDRNDPGAAFRP